MRVFVSTRDNPYDTEQFVLRQMAQITSDSKWEQIQNVKALTLEHKMAASRLGFKNFYESLHKVPSYRQGLIDGSLSVVGVLTHILIPLHQADLNNNPFEKAKVVKENAFIFKDKDFVLTNELLQELQTGVDTLSACWSGKDPSCYELLRIIYEKKIFSLSKDIEQMFENPPSEGDEDFQKISNLSAALNSPFSEVERYWEYVNGQASFDTHQGVKGLEFERVMVIIDDNAARSNTFSYDKLFGFEPKSDADIKNESEGKDTILTGPITQSAESIIKMLSEFCFEENDEIILSLVKKENLIPKAWIGDVSETCKYWCSYIALKCIVDKKDKKYLSFFNELLEDELMSWIEFTDSKYKNKLTLEWKSKYKLLVEKGIKKIK